MLDIYQLEQLLAVAEYGTLSKAAEELHLSQPALTRSMKRLEEELQVTLFERQKNRIAFNENGKLAVEHARRVMEQINDMVSSVRAFDRSRRTVSVGSCAPAPLWEIAPLLSQTYPQMTISTAIQEKEQLIQGLEDDVFQAVILAQKPEDEGLYCVKYREEQLFFSLPTDHPKAGAEKLYFKDLDGETMLLFSRIGFWHKIHKEKMPHTKFLLQEERFAFQQLVKSSGLPSFTSNIAMKRQGAPENRVVIPIADEEAHAVYYCVCKKKNAKGLEALFEGISGQQ